MNKIRNIFLFILGAIVIVVGVLWVSLLFKKPQMSHDFQGVMGDGTRFNLHDNIGVQNTALIFFDPEVDGSNEVFEKLAAHKEEIDIVGVSVNNKLADDQLLLLPESVKDIKKLCFNCEAVDIYNIGNAPVLYFIDKQGYVKESFIGSVKESSIKKAIDKMA